MKTKNLIILASFLFLFDFVSFAFSQDAESPEVGMIKAVTGKVRIHRGDKKEAAKKAMELTGGKRREATKTEPITSNGTQLEYAESARDKEDKQKTRENIDALIKELEAVVKEQTKKEKPKVAKTPKEKKPEIVEVPQAVPISLKEFTLKMGLLSNRRDMERFRQRIIDALLSQKGLSVVGRDLEFQEEILRNKGLAVLSSPMRCLELD